jgi:hypothetical protein
VIIKGANTAHNHNKAVVQSTILLVSLGCSVTHSLTFSIIGVTVSSNLAIAGCKASHICCFACNN